VYAADHLISVGGFGKRLRKLGVIGGPLTNRPLSNKSSKTNPILRRKRP
jgi:hypothetical protein